MRPDIDEMVDAAVLVDAQGAVRAINAAFGALLGWTGEDLVGRPLQSLLVPDHDDAGGMPAQRDPSSASGGEDVAGVRRYRRRDGGFLWSEAVSLPLFGKNGASCGFVVMLYDRSDRSCPVDGIMALIGFIAGQNVRSGVDLMGFLSHGCRCFDLDAGLLFRVDDGRWRVEAASGDLDQLLADTFDPSSLMSSGDEVTAIEPGNEACSRWRAVCRESGIDALLACAVQGADRQFGALCFVGRAKRARPFDSGEKAVMRFLARWLATRLEADEARRSCEQAQQRLLRSEERYRSLYEKTPAMLHSIDDRGRLASVSDAWLATLGYTREEVIGRLSTDFLTPESRRYAHDVVLPAYRSLGYCDDIAYQMVTKGGDIRDILLSAISQTEEDGRFFRSLAILRDVTEQRRVERSLAGKTAALQRSNADLARFAHIASHDLQEPLRRIVAYCDLLKEDYGEELSEGAAAIAGIIQSGGRRLRLMINGLLAYVRVGEQLDGDVEPVDISAILCHVLDDLEEDILSRGVRVDVPHLPLVWGRASFFKTLFHQLLSNAIWHGGGPSPMIEVSVEDAGDVWRFAVTDNGTGIEPRFADRVFEIFQRLHLRDELTGSGAGLAICQLIVQHCGGDIWLDRSYRQGARFFFTLPKERTMYSAPAAATTAAWPDRIDTVART
ncbi:MAG: PAS domain S-box protein [Geminicoccaceae bacterium]